MHVVSVYRNRIIYTIHTDDSAPSETRNNDDPETLPHNVSPINLQLKRNTGISVLVGVGTTYQNTISKQRLKKINRVFPSELCCIQKVHVRIAGFYEADICMVGVDYEMLRCGRTVSVPFYCI